MKVYVVLHQLWSGDYATTDVVKAFTAESDAIAYCDKLRLDFGLQAAEFGRIAAIHGREIEMGGGVFVVQEALLVGPREGA